MIEIPSWLVLASASYFAFTAGSILLILYKTATSGWRVRWRLRKLGQSQIEFPLTKRLHREANKVRLVLVHGTWALRGDWHKPVSAYLEELARRIDELCPDVEVDVYRFLWSGGNTVTDRARAIARLASAECWGSEVPIIVVAHSHGGNIVVNVLDENPALASSVQSIITVATPFLVSRRRPMALAVPLAIVSAALSACGLTAGAVPLLQSSLGSTNEQVYAIAGLLALLLFGCIFWQAGRIRASVNGGLPDDRILKKLLVVRASG